MSRTKRSKPRLSPLARLHRGDREGGFAMAVSLLLIVTVVGLSAGVAGIVAGEVQPTQYQAKQTLTLNNGQSGVEAALDAIRASSTFATLPCGPVSGTVSGTSSGATYKATIKYFTTDPSTHVYDTNWLNANAMTCSSTAPAFPATSQQPAYAFVQSAGDGAAIGGYATSSAGANAGNRAFHIVYKLATGTNYTIGGSVSIGSPPGNTTSSTLCLDTGSVDPSAGQSIATNNCPASGSSTPTQDFQFVPASDGYHIVFGGNPSANLCLAQTGVQAISLLSCTNGDSSQAFTVNAAGQMVAANGQCLGSSAIGGALTTQVCAGAPTNTSITASVQSGLAAASVGVTTANGGIAIGASACVLNCAIGVNVQSVIDPATNTYAASLSITLFGLQMCTTVGISGGSPLLAFGVGGACSGQTVVATTPPSAPATVAATSSAAAASASPSFSGASVETAGEDAGGQS